MVYLDAQRMSIGGPGGRQEALRGRGGEFREANRAWGS